MPRYKYLINFLPKEFIMRTNIVFYQRPIYEFNTYTAPLSLIEVGAFTKLIDYLILHQTLPNTERKYFLLNIKKKPEKQALDFVLNEFCFINDDGDYESEIANNIICKSLKVAEVNSIKGKKSSAARDKKNKSPVEQTITETETETVTLTKKETITKSSLSNNSATTSQNQIARCENDDFASSVDICCDDNTATQICIDLRKQGLAQVNPTYPKLQKAVALGATSQMFCDAYNELKMQKRNIAKPFPYLVSTVINRINETHSISIPVNNNNANQRPKFTQQQKSDIVASMSLMDITNRDYLPVLLENGYRPELKENNDCSYTLLTIEEMQNKINNAINNAQQNVIDINDADLFATA